MNGQQNTNDGHDAASIVGQMLGLGDQSAPTPERVPPSALITRFCADTSAMRAAVADAGSTAEAMAKLKDMEPGAAVAHRDEAGLTMYRGHCGYSGGRGDRLATGFDDGYDFMGYLTEHGWRALSSKGNWPYVVWLRWPALDGEPETMIEYCEADLTVHQFDTHEAARAFYAGIRDAE